MKITRIQADNLLGIQHVDVSTNTAVTLFCGRNGSGKSSIQEAVRMAICQDQVRDVTVKKEYGKLLHGDAKAGGAVVMVDNDPDKSFAFHMPKGEFTGPEITDPMRVALNGQRFAQMKPDERRTFLFGLTKLRATGKATRERMLSKKWACDEKKTDAVLPMLNTGFPSACTYAKEKATEAKGAWRAMTGATYGPIAAPNWEASTPEVPEGDVEKMAADVAGLDKNIAKMNESLGAIKATARSTQENAQRRANLAEGAGKVPGLVDQLERAKVELAEYLPKVEALRLRAAGTARVGLVHDMAAYLKEFNDSDPDIKDEAVDALLARYEKEHGALGAKIDHEAQAQLPEHEKGLLVMQNRVRNLQRDLDSATQAKGQFDALEPAGEAVDASKEIAEVEAMLATAKANRLALENKRLDIVTATAARAAAADKTANALKHHEEVMAWLKVADALAPDGIPADMLLDALQPVNAALEQAAVDTDWAQVVISPDMSITAKGRPYQMLSESEKWRTDAMIAQVVSEISGLRILMLDRFDVLDMPGRVQCLEWVDTLALSDVVDTVLLFGTLKAAPVGLADTITVHWVEGGLVPLSEQERAAA